MKRNKNCLDCDTLILEVSLRCKSCAAKVFKRPPRSENWRKKQSLCQKCHNKTKGIKTNL